MFVLCVIVKVKDFFDYVVIVLVVVKENYFVFGG